MMTSPVRCSVVVCTRDRPDALARCLAAVRTGRLQPYELIVVDNAPSMPADRIAAEHGATCVVEPVRGLGIARNTGARAATGDVVCYVDDDAVPDAGWLLAIAREFEDPRVSVVTGCCEPLEQAGSAEARDLSRAWWSIPGGRWAIDEHTPHWEQRTVTGKLGTGANMSFRRSVFGDWKGFDERLGTGTAIPGFEEHEAFLALLTRGARLVHAPDALVLHPAADSLESFSKSVARTRGAYVSYLLLLLQKYPRYRWRLMRIAWQQFWHGDGHGAAASRTTLDTIRAIGLGVQTFLAVSR